MNKLRIGDRVEILYFNGSAMSEGETGTVVEVTSNNWIMVQDFLGKSWAFTIDMLKYRPDLEPASITPKSVTRSSVLTLPTDSAERKNYPMLNGCLKYFPAALSGVAKTSKLGNDKHNPGQPLHHARGKSADHGDCIIRHLTDTEDLLAALERKNTDVTPEKILLEVNQLAWRVLAYSQELHEKFGAPMAPGAKADLDAK